MRNEDRLERLRAQATEVQEALNKIRDDVEEISKRLNELLEEIPSPINADGDTS